MVGGVHVGLVGEVRECNGEGGASRGKLTLSGLKLWQQHGSGGEDLVFLSLPHLVLVCPGLRVYLTSDGRDEYCGGVGGGRVLLPAEGALFLTNYHLIFKGSPLDTFSSEHSVCRAFTITSLTKEKLFSMNEYISEIDQVLKNGIQLRYSTFQLIGAVFDDQVTAEEIANLRSLIHHTQFPQTLWHHIAFWGILLLQEPSKPGKNKNNKYSTLKGLAGLTIKNAAKLA